MSALGTFWKRLFDEQRDAYLLGLLRLALSILLLLHCGRLGLELLNTGYFGDFFHLPLIPQAWVVNRAGYTALLALQALACGCAFLAVLPREALFVAASIGLYILCCDRLQYHNNRYALLLLCFLLCFTPCDRSFVPTRGRAPAPSPEQRRAPTFGRRLFQIQVSLVYLSSALGKLIDPDWRTGQVLLLRFARTGDYFAQHGIALPSWLVLPLTSAGLAGFAAAAAIGCELSIALGTWYPPTRRLALWMGVLFHIGIEISAKVELFSYLMIASYLAFVRPELRERRFEFDPKTRAGRASAKLVARLDWCARFEILALPANACPVAGFRVTDRLGRVASGSAGLALLAEAIPVLFPLWLPLTLLGRCAGQRRGRVINE